ncbi:uncharacterized protein LOC112562426 [Pomacea canaliculata]|uniref:uncharacterized protein LOC112562426 n=1 Tax=Pomacea canaliculata TaxID=400727 RepID=UPI000D729EFC|nr:uncharacterized protein LOC112562426 [Pomacea canaliculata]
MYLVVQFTNEKEIALIPSTWLDGDSCAKWPPYKNPDKINKAVKDKLLPESNWKSYPIEGLFGNSSYEKAWKWLKEETERNEMKPIQSQEPDLDMHVVKIEHGSDLALQPDTSDTIAFDPRQRQPSTTNVESIDGKEDQEDPPPYKRPRKANWSNKEIWMLLEEVRLEKECLMSSLGNEITNRKKAAVWQRIADKLAASCSTEHRSLVSVREKWGTLKSEAQRRRDKRKSTESGAVKYCEYDNVIFEILGEGSNLTDGIDGGTDMFSLRTSTNCSDNPSVTVTSDRVTCIENDQLSLKDIPSTSFATENSVKLVEGEMADSSQRKPSMDTRRDDCKEDTGFCMKQEDCSEEESDTFYQTQKRGKLTPSGTSDVLKSSPSPAEEEVKKKNGSFPSFSHITFDSSQQSTSTITPCVHSSIFPSTSWTTSSSISSNEDGMQSRFLFLLEELCDEVKVMRSEVKKALKVMEYIRNNTSGTMDQVKLPEGYEFPLASVKEAERLDADLKADAEKRRHLEHYLAMLGGFNLRSALKAILSALFSTQLARQYNYNGLKGKKGLKSLNSIMQIIYTAVRKHFQDATEADIRVHLSKWLSTARDRDYGRRERNNKRHRVEKAINERGSAQESS